MSRQDSSRISLKERPITISYAVNSNNVFGVVGCLSNRGLSGRFHDPPDVSPIFRHPVADKDVPGSDARI
jgi:hypothetical protein